MACPCNDCTDLQDARNSVTRISLLELCMTKVAENCEVALELSTADDHLKKAQAILTKKHLRDGPFYGHRDGHAGNSSKSAASKHSEEGSAQDGALVLRGKNSSSTSSGGSAKVAAVGADRRATGARTEGAHHGALVLRQEDRSFEETSSPPVNNRRPPAAAVAAERGRQNARSFSAQDSLRAFGQQSRSFDKTIAPPPYTEQKTMSPPASTYGGTSSSFEPKHDNTSPQHFRQVSSTTVYTNPWVGESIGSIEVSERFEHDVRNKAAELGILRGVNFADDNDGVEGSQQATGPDPYNTGEPTKEKVKFIVCDHCRSHGLRCNEASVCKECILRETPCIHRMCDLSPYSKDACPRQVCFYVHQDFMPDVYGAHDPGDPSWLVLPGKLRDHLSAGGLSKLKPVSEAEVMRCYSNFARRQQNAMVEMTNTVAKGGQSWESMKFECPCREIEYEEQQAKIADDTTRRLKSMALAQGLRI